MLMMTLASNPALKRFFSSNALHLQSLIQMTFFPSLTRCCFILMADFIAMTHKFISHTICVCMYHINSQRQGIWWNMISALVEWWVVFEVRDEKMGLISVQMVQKKFKCRAKVIQALQIEILILRRSNCSHEW